LIFLNKTCFNGVYRENQKGEFNVPFGKVARISEKIVDNIREVSRKLSGTNIAWGGFEEILKKARAKDFVYLDPPYVPLKAAGFTKYHASDFSLEDHAKLAKVFDELVRRGCFVLMSNSLTEEVRDLYSKYWMHTVEVDAMRNINCKGELRQPVKEVLIRNYGSK
jgi:DNA adenine methylase